MALKTIGNGALKGTGLRTIEIPKSVFWLGDGLVADCQSMEYVKIPENIGKIPDHMFEGCTNLKKVELHEKLGAIGERAFFFGFYCDSGQCKADRAGRLYQYRQAVYYSMLFWLLCRRVCKKEQIQISAGIA